RELVDAVEQAALELARPTAHEVDRDPDACVHVADHALPGDQRVDVARGGREHLAQPLLHRGLEPVADLFHRQEPARARVGHHPAVEVVGHVRQRELGHPREQRRDLRARRTQQRPPGIGQVRVVGDGGPSGFVVLGAGGGLVHSTGDAGGPRILAERASRGWPARRYSSRMSKHITDEAVQELATRVGAAAQRRHHRVVTAESCTGGWISKALTDIAGSSAWFECGIAAYSYEAKQALLGVQPATLEAHGAVSRETAIEMVSGALVHSGASLAVAVTGIAGPSGGTEDKP